MAVNQAEIEFFKTVEQQSTDNKEPTVESYREQAPGLMQLAGNPANVKYEEQSILSRDGYKIPIRVYNYNLGHETPVLIFFPGCSYIVDLFELNAIACSRIAAHSNIRVIIANARLAPEYPLPIPIYDNYDVVSYIAKNSELFKIDSSQIFIGGLSSGAHCAAIIANLAMKDDSLKLYHQILLNGSFDLKQTNNKYREFEKEDKLCVKEAVNFVYKQWGIKEEEFINPLFSPFYETNLTNIPTTIIIGEYDGIRGHSEAYFEKLNSANNYVEKIILPGQTHNTIIMRGVMSDGVDPAVIIADTIKRHMKCRILTKELSTTE